MKKRYRDEILVRCQLLTSSFNPFCQGKKFLLEIAKAKRTSHRIES